MIHYRILLLLIAFAIIASILYAVCPRKQRYISLLLTSLVFYFVAFGKATVFLLVTIITSYYVAIFMDKVSQKYDMTGLEKAERKKLKAEIKSKKRRILILYSVINISILMILKYLNFFAASSLGFLSKFGIDITMPVVKMILPFGISYYTLQSLSYAIDVFRGKYKGEKNILKVALFISFFPQLHEGPFGRYDELMTSMESGEQIKTDNCYNGIARMLWGIFKILMIANRASIVSDHIFSNSLNYSGVTIIIGVIAFTIQLYAEFSGYIDIAAGISMIFGIRLKQNFDMPFISENVGEFWRRWHISLGLWFRDYIFYPISTSKKMMKLGKKMDYKYADFITITTSLLAVWFLTGLWHGASFKYVAYGIYYFVLMILYNLLTPYFKKMLKGKESLKSIKVICIIKTLALVEVGMLMFRAQNLLVFKQMLISICSFEKPMIDICAVIEFKDFVLLNVSLIVLIISSIFKIKGIDISNKYNELSTYKKYWICFGVFCIIVIFGAYGLGYLPPDPIYGGF